MNTKLSTKTNENPNENMGEIREMTDKELDAVNGGKAHGGVSGKLFEQCCKGTHLPEVIIE